MENTEVIINEICKNVFGNIPDRMKLCTIGLANIVYIVEIKDKKYVIRLNREKGAFLNSKELLKQAIEIGLPVPRFIDSGNINEMEYMIITFMEGEDLGIVYSKLCLEDKKNIAKEIVDMQQKAKNFVDNFSTTPFDKYFIEILNGEEKIIRDAKYFDVEKVSKVKNLLQEMKDYFDNLTPVPFLDDISTKNLLIKNGRVSGIVDIDEIGYGDPLTCVALMRVALLNMDCDDTICDYILDYMNVDSKQRKAEIFYCLSTCITFMRERGQIFNGRKIEVNKEVIDRLNNIYDKFMKKWNENC